MLRFNLLMAGIFILSLNGCSEAEQNRPEAIRSVKIFEVSRGAGGDVRKFSGKIEAANSANLSFAVAGTVEVISASVGENVQQGQILAALDKEPFILDVQAAEAELRKARSSANEKEEDYKRNKQLFDKGWVSKAALEQAQFALETVLGDVSYKTTRLNQAKRSLSDAQLIAPYSGVVGQQFVEPNEEVAGGNEILRLDASGALEMSISVPEKTIAKLNMGMPAKVTFSALPDVTVEGRVTEISRVAGSGNVFPVKVSLNDPPATLRAGMSGDVSVTTQNEPGEFGFLVPLSALAAAESLKDSYVFVFDPAASTISKKEVLPETVRGNLVAVKGIEAGDLVVTAGVSFLSDGQKVKRYVPAVN